MFRCEITLKLDQALERILDRDLQALRHKLENIMAVLDDLTANVTANTNAVQSAITLLQNLKAQLDAAGTDPVKLQALSDALGKNDSDLAAAVAANTPAASQVPAS